MDKKLDHPQAFDLQTELVFHSPSLREAFGAAGLTMLVICLLIALILGGVIAFVAGSPWAIAIYGVVILIGAGSLAAVLVCLRGRVVLDAHGLVEYNGLNASRRFAYDQIFGFKNGAYADTLVIHYYPRLKNGAVDRLHPRRTRLILVKNSTGLKLALARRLTAARPAAPEGKERLPVLILLVLLLLAFPILLLWGLNLH